MSGKAPRARKAQSLCAASDAGTEQTAGSKTTKAPGLKKLKSSSNLLADIAGAIGHEDDKPVKRPRLRSHECGACGQQPSESIEWAMYKETKKRGGEAHREPLDDRCKKCCVKWGNHFSSCYDWAEYCVKVKDGSLKTALEEIGKMENQAADAKSHGHVGVTTEVSHRLTMKRPVVMVSEPAYVRCLEASKLPATQVIPTITIPDGAGGDRKWYMFAKTADDKEGFDTRDADLETSITVVQSKKNFDAAASSWTDQGKEAMKKAVKECNGVKFGPIFLPADKELKTLPEAVHDWQSKQKAKKKHVEDKGIVFEGTAPSSAAPNTEGAADQDDEQVTIAAAEGCSVMDFDIKTPKKGALQESLAESSSPRDAHDEEGAGA